MWQTRLRSNRLKIAQTKDSLQQNRLKFERMIAEIMMMKEGIQNEDQTYLKQILMENAVIWSDWKTNNKLCILKAGSIKGHGLFLIIEL